MLLANIKIFVTHRIDKDNAVVKNEILTPIRCGAVFDKRTSDILGDDTGENISHKRSSFCELTTQYWAWKNVDVDYYGFCHYRRYFSFNLEKLDVDWDGFIKFHYFNEDVQKQLRLNDINHIKTIVKQYDLIVSYTYDWELTIYDQYRGDSHRHGNDLDLTLEIIKDIYPEFFDCAKDYFFKHKGPSLFCNMFIMKKDLFFNYSKWLFDILFEFEKRVDTSLLSTEGVRAPAHISERLLGVYCDYLKKQNKHRFGYLQSAFIQDASVVKTLAPIWDDAITIVLSTSLYFVPMNASTVQSIIDHADPSRKYDILIMENDLPEKIKLLYCKMVKEIPNISIRFLNVNQKIEKYKLYIGEMYTIHTYFRLLIPDLLPEYKKVLYLDSDIIVMDDVSGLFNMDISHSSIAGIRDIVMAGWINGYSPDFHIPYLLNRLEIKKENIYRYVNGGVLLMNLDNIRRQYSAVEMLEYAQKKRFDMVDQDVLNSLFQDHIFHVPFEWNISPDEQGSFRHNILVYAPHDIYSKYMVAHENPKIIHFADREKPWDNPSMLFADEFWCILRKTPFYETMLLRKIESMKDHYNQINQSQLHIMSVPKISFIMRVANKFFPYSSKRRSFVKRTVNIILPVGSKRRRLVARVYRGIK